MKTGAPLGAGVFHCSKVHNSFLLVNWVQISVPHISILHILYLWYSRRGFGLFGLRCAGGISLLLLLLLPLPHLRCLPLLLLLLVKVQVRHHSLQSIPLLYEKHNLKEGEYPTQRR